MKAYIKKHLKDEKRILKLCYQKGLMHDDRILLKNLAWEELRQGKKQRRRKKEYSFSDYLPELHVFFSDYWGEGDSKGVIDIITEQLYWKNVIDDTANYEVNGGWPESTFKYKGRSWFIKYLKQLPTKFRGTEINTILRVGSI